MSARTRFSQETSIALFSLSEPNRGCCFKAIRIEFPGWLKPLGAETTRPNLQFGSLTGKTETFVNSAPQISKVEGPAQGSSRVMQMLCQLKRLRKRPVRLGRLTISKLTKWVRGAILIRMRIYDGYSVSIKTATYLDHISHCKTASGTH